MRRYATLLSLVLVALVLALPALAAPQEGHAAPEEEASASEAGHGEPEAGHGASEEGHGEGASPNPFAGDVGNAVWTLLIFFVLLFVLGKYAWGPVLEGLQSRERFIRESLEEARQNRDEARARLEEYEAKLASARAEVDEIMAEARRDAEALRKREEERARGEAEKTLERARREIQIATDTAVKEIYERATKLSVDAASRILGREISASDHERLIAESIDSLEKMDTH